MIKRYKIENTDETYLRIWQKVNFNKEILKQDFFTVKQIKDSRESIRLRVYQFDQNTRLVYLDNYLYQVTSDEPLYNYLDNDRVISLYNNERYNSHSKVTMYIFNEIIITDKEIIDFEDYRDKKDMGLKVLSDTDREIIYLVFNEDLAKIKKDHRS